MKSLAIIFTCFMIPVLAKSQETQTKPINQWDVNFATVTQQEPFYPAGDKALFSYIRSSIKFSQAAISERLRGSIMLTFDVAPDSTLSNIVIINGMGSEIDDQVVRLFAPLKFAPGIQNSTKVSMNTILTFTVSAQ